MRLKMHSQDLLEAGVQLIWQCGKRYYESLRPQVPQHHDLHLMAFIDDMAAAYAAADLVISRAGGSTISEVIALSKPCYSGAFSQCVGRPPDQKCAFTR